MDVEIKLEGFKELARELRDMPEKIGRNVLRAAVNAGATAVRREVQTRAPVDTGRLRRSIYQRQVREQSNLQRQVFHVGVRSGVRRNEDGSKDRSRDAWYWRFIEFGTVKLPARPFLRPAFESRQTEAIEAMRRRLKERIERFRVQGR